MGTLIILFGRNNFRDIAAGEVSRFHSKAVSDATQDFSTLPDFSTRTCPFEDSLFVSHCGLHRNISDLIRPDPSPFLLTCPDPRRVARKSKSGGAARPLFGHARSGPETKIGQKRSLNAQWRRNTRKRVTKIMPQLPGQVVYFFYK